MLPSSPWPISIPWPAQHPASSPSPTGTVWEWAPPLWLLPAALLGQGTPELMGHPRWGHLSLHRSSRTAPGVSSGPQGDVRELQAFLEQQQSTKPSQTTPDPNYRGRAGFKLALGKARQVY